MCKLFENIEFCKNVQNSSFRLPQMKMIFKVRTFCNSTYKANEKSSILLLSIFFEILRNEDFVFYTYVVFLISTRIKQKYEFCILEKKVF